MYSQAIFLMIENQFDQESIEPIWEDMLNRLKRRVTSEGIVSRTVDVNQAVLEKEPKNTMCIYFSKNNLNSESFNMLFESWPSVEFYKMRVFTRNGFLLKRLESLREQAHKSKAEQISDIIFDEINDMIESDYFQNSAFSFISH